MANIGYSISQKDKQKEYYFSQPLTWYLNYFLMKQILNKRPMQRITALAVILLILVFQTYAQPAKPAKSGYAPVNGLKIYYEIYGEGQPLVLLHGSYMTIHLNWAELIPELSKTRKVIALEIQGHGHTADTDRPLSFPSLASDVAGVMKYLKVDSADIIGYSLGGAIAYGLAIQSPALVKKMVIISGTYKTEGWQPEVRSILQTMQPVFLDNTPLKTEYISVAPDTSYWHKFLAKMINFNNTAYNLGDGNIKSIKSPVLLIIGDNDGIDKTVLADTYKLLGGAIFGDMAGIPKSQLAIIPGKTHVSLMMDTGIILSTVNTFLNIPAGK
jgi:pimeloyl-ACP methyl ester carboxylesterase